VLPQDGTFDVRVLDEMNSQVRGVSSSQLRLVEPKKRSFVKVMSGSKRGVIGKVKVMTPALAHGDDVGQAIEGNDVMIEISSREDIQVFRLSQVARVDDGASAGHSSSYYDRR
jgi:hypothetical protein